MRRVCHADLIILDLINNIEYFRLCILEVLAIDSSAGVRFPAEPGIFLFSTI
jgi:hypothetical protein